jgi:catechol 2,3-dioxygenase-like lactoylglutathione lyase family enzyme
MPIELHSVTFESPDPERDAEFWAAVLGRSSEIDAGGILLAGGHGQLGLRFAFGAAHGTAMNRLHLHLTEDARGQRETIAVCLSLGARLGGSGHVPENDCAYLADVVNDEFCVIEDGNGYLAGCGPLGEVTIDGSREVGHFWSEALGWPLVWEVGDERVIQSPAGGTKVAWGGESVAARPEKGRQYFVFTVPADEFDSEVERLVALGATRPVVDPTGEVTLRDPDGTSFVLRAVGG